MCVCAHGVWACTNGLSSEDLRCHSSSITQFFLLLRQRLSTGLELAVWAGWLAGEPQDPLVSASPPLGLQMHSTMLRIFVWALKIELSSLCLQS